MINYERHRRTISRGFEFISEDLTMVTDSDSVWRKIINISPSDHCDRKREQEDKAKSLNLIYDAFREDAG
jgi:hypothetical protein